MVGAIGFLTQVAFAKGVEPTTPPGLRSFSEGGCSQITGQFQKDRIPIPYGFLSQ
jgi:hypothetical protein